MSSAFRHPRRAIAAAAVVAAVCLVTIGFPGAPRTASAHAVLVRSDPPAEARLASSPAAITLTFSEPFEARFTSFRVLGADGVARPLGEFHVVDARDPRSLTASVATLAPGIYTVVYRTLSSVDSHPWTGSFTFTVLTADGGEPAGAAFAPSVGGTPGGAVAGRWLAFLALALVLGGAAVTRLAVAGAGAWEAPLVRDVRRLVRGLDLAAVPLLLAGAAAELSAQIAATGASRSALLSGSRFGTLWLWRQAAVALLCVVLALAWAAAARRRERLARALEASLVVPALGAVVTLSLLGHAAATNGSAWSVAADVVHLATAALWVGGLAVLASLFVHRRAVGAAGGAALGSIVARFSPWATGALYVIVLTGIFRAFAEFPTAASVPGTGYGRALLVKDALIGATLVVAVVNRRAARGPWDAGVATGAAAGAAVRRLRATLPLEAALGAAVLLVAALLTQLPAAVDAVAAPAPPAAASGQPYTGTQHVGDLSLALSVAPAAVGSNTLGLRVTPDGGGAPPAGTRVLFSLVSPGFGEAGARVEATPSGANAFNASAAFSGLTARWEVEVQVRRPGHDDVLARFDVPMAVPQRTGTAAPAATPAPATHPFGYPLTAGNWGTLAGALLIAAGPPLLMDARRRRGLRSARRLAGVAVPLAGAVVLLGAAWWPGGGGVAPPPFQPAVAMRFETAAADRFVLLEADPFQVGANAFHVTVLDAHDRAVAAGAVALRVSRLDDAVAPVTVPAAPAGANHVYAASALLDRTGWWDIDVLLDGAPGASFYVRLDAPSRAPLAWAPAAANETPDPAAEALFRRALARYGTVSSMRWTDQITSGQLAPDGIGGWVRNDGLGIAPDQVRITTSEAIGGPAINRVVRKGPIWCTQSQGDPWNCRVGAVLPPFNPDDFSHTTAFRLGRAEVVDGHPTHVVSFYSVPQQYWYAWWIDDATADLRREALLGPYHIMVTTYADHGAPATITLPPEAAGIVPPTATATATPTPSLSR